MHSGGPARLATAARRGTAISLGKSIRYLSRGLGRGGGTTLPGHVANRFDRGLLMSLARDLPNGCVLVTGTNGKTTTTRILAEVARADGFHVITNPEGSNLLSGIATSLLIKAIAQGRLDVPPSAIGVFEVDEGALGPAIEALDPRLVVITNLFRDQLDRYFEVDFVAGLWQRSLRRLPSGATVVLNADDAAVSFLGDDLSAQVRYFGLNDRECGKPGLEHAADSRRCPRCDHDLLYELNFYAHLGHYVCKECDWRRPDPEYAAQNVLLHGAAGSTLEIRAAADERLLKIPLAGLYNAYNALAAAAGASCLGISPSSFQAGVREITGAFGRLEPVRLGAKQAVLLLVKNPSGFTEALRLVLSLGPRARLILGLNDNEPDGRDVSWIWDVDFEQCRERISYLAVAGTRAHDLALRLKYAGIVTSRGRLTGCSDDASDEMPQKHLLVDEDMTRSFFTAVEQAPAGTVVYVLSSYTAMWTLRRALVRRGFVAPFWRQTSASPGAGHVRGAATGRQAGEELGRAL
jgi:lipid II isoglutaminyl synthase (glutamine-hydrolysing)